MGFILWDGVTGSRMHVTSSYPMDKPGAHRKKGPSIHRFATEKALNPLLSICNFFFAAKMPLDNCIKWRGRVESNGVQTFGSWNDVDGQGHGS